MLTSFTLRQNFQFFCLLQFFEWAVKHESSCQIMLIDGKTTLKCDQIMLLVNTWNSLNEECHHNFDSFWEYM